MSDKYREGHPFIVLGIAARKPKPYTLQSSGTPNKIVAFTIYVIKVGRQWVVGGPNAGLVRVWLPLPLGLTPPSVYKTSNGLFKRGFGPKGIGQAGFIRGNWLGG